MKDSEFIELLNLYLDHEIGAADAARLEAEVQGNAERRRIYQQYCRMQKACTMLAKDFNEQPATAEAAGRKVVAFEATARRGSWGAGIFAASGLAAAACVALVLVNRSPEAAPMSGSAVAAASVPAQMAPVSAAVETKVSVAQNDPVTTHAGISRTVTIPSSRRSDLQPVLAVRSLALSDSVNNAQASSAELPPQLDWVGGLKIAPMQQVQLADLRFDAAPAQPVKAATYGSPQRSEPQGLVEKVAFKITK